MADAWTGSLEDISHLIGQGPQEGSLCGTAGLASVHGHSPEQRQRHPVAHLHAINFQADACLSSQLRVQAGRSGQASHAACFEPRGGCSACGMRQTRHQAHQVWVCPHHQRCPSRCPQRGCSGPLLEPAVWLLSASAPRVSSWLPDGRHSAPLPLFCSQFALCCLLHLLLQKAGCPQHALPMPTACSLLAQSTACMLRRIAVHQHQPDAAWSLH